jgi:hypothetical protein
MSESGHWSKRFVGSGSMSEWLLRSSPRGVCGQPRGRHVFIPILARCRLTRHVLRARLLHVTRSIRCYPAVCSFYTVVTRYRITLKVGNSLLEASTDSWPRSVASVMKPQIQTQADVMESAGSSSPKTGRSKGKCNFPLFSISRKRCWSHARVETMGKGRLALGGLRGALTVFAMSKFFVGVFRAYRVRDKRSHGDRGRGKKRSRRQAARFPPGSSSIRFPCAGMLPIWYCRVAICEF